jgi:fermentation-respiration switch protein FrsA (DUF1100 family)
MPDPPPTLLPLAPEGTLDPAAGLNLALDVVDALLQLAVIAIQDAPPGSPADGDRYIVGTGSGAWSGEDGNLARYVDDGAFWQFLDAGDQARIVLNLADMRIYVWHESEGWVPYPVLSSLTDAADDTAAAGAGVPVGALYRNGSVLQIRVS